MKKKVKIIVEGILIPYMLYLIITLLVAFIYMFFTKNNKPNAILIQGIANVFIFIVLLPLYLIFIKKYQIKIESLNLKKIIYILPLAFSICLIGNILVDYIPRETENRVTAYVYELAEEYNLLLSLIMVSFVIPIIEELLFRGFFYETIKMLSNDIFAIIFTCVTFAIAHLDLRQSIYALFAGVFLSYTKYKFKGLIYPILLHLLMNMITLVFVPSVIGLNSEVNKIYMLFISFSILFFTVYRINHKTIS